MNPETEKYFTAPVLGAAYYPEDWDEAEQDSDIAYMKKAGLKCVRMAEFAWHKMEPEEGLYDFSWLHRVMRKLWDAGISVVLGTPTATPPIWLEEKEPKMRRVNENGLQELHGGRRHCCSNNSVYRKYSALIVEKMAEEFGSDERVVGWQIDNEIYINGTGCFCEECRRGFHEYLAEKYGTIEQLNKRWNLNVFSQWYDSFEQIPAPARSWQNPHLKYEWMAFQSRSHVEFIRMQAEILRKYTRVPIGTDMMPLFSVDHEKIAEFTDVMQFNHYNTEKDIWWSMFWLDYMRGLKDRPFWNTETSTCWNGSVETSGNIRPEGFCRVNSWMPVALGAESNFYWLWRQHWAGHELMHGSVLYASGRPMHTFGEVQEVSAGYEKCGAFLSGTKVKTDVAIMVSTQNHLLMTQQAVVWEAPDYVHLYRIRVYDLYKKFAENGTRPDVIGANKSLQNYKLLFTPFMLTLEIGDLQERIEKWVREGGTWLVGPMTDIRNDIGAHYQDRETGILERMTGAVLTDQIPDYEHRVECSWVNGYGAEENGTFSAYTWLQCFEIPADAEAIVTVTGRYHSALSGKAVVFRKKLGKGSVVVLGTIPSKEDLQRLMEIVMAESGAQHFEVTGNAAVARREGEAGEGYAVVGYSDQPASLKLDGRYVDLISEENYDGELMLKPFQVTVLKKI